MADGNQLAEFLRARREQVAPVDVGLPSAERRRVRGLRREEVALLAGISADYYTRLEQSRGQRPSEGVLDAIARALNLDDTATAYLYRLARPDPPGVNARIGADEPIRPELQDLLDAWTGTPALIQNAAFDVLASNSLARELSPCYEPGTNLLRSIFLDPAVRERHVGIERDLAATVAYFRATIGAETDNPYLRRIVEELSMKSQEFRDLWARHDVTVNLTGKKEYRHPIAGELTLHYESLSVPADDGLSLLVLSAAPGSEAAHALSLLSAAAEATAREVSQPVAQARSKSPRSMLSPIRS